MQEDSSSIQLVAKLKKLYSEKKINSKLSKYNPFVRENVAKEKWQIKRLFKVAIDMKFLSFLRASARHISTGFIIAETDTDDDRLVFLFLSNWNSCFGYFDNRKMKAAQNKQGVSKFRPNFKLLT